jgi:hypothetical protein
MRRSSLAFTAMALGAALLAAPARSQSSTVGKTPEYKWSSPLQNGYGAQSLADLRGKPTLIEFWGTY